MVAQNTRRASLSSSEAGRATAALGALRHQLVARLASFLVLHPSVSFVPLEVPGIWSTHRRNYGYVPFRRAFLALVKATSLPSASFALLHRTRSQLSGRKVPLLTYHNYGYASLGLKPYDSLTCTLAPMAKCEACAKKRYAMGSM